MQYAELTKIQKMAAFLILLGSRSAAAVMKDFEPSELEPICREMIAMPLIPAAVQQQLLDEFAGIVADGATAVSGGAELAHAALGLAKGEHAASAILNRCASEGRGTAASPEIQRMDARHIFNLVKTEGSQTIAFILSCLEAAKAAEVMRMLPAEIREEVVERLGAMEPTSAESIQKVANNLLRRVSRGATASSSVHRGGGVQGCADLLNALDKESRKALLTRIEERDPSLGAAIRNKIFTFDDITRLSPTDLQRVMRDVDAASLPVALKTAKTEVAGAILAAMSKRAAQAVRDEIDMLGAPKARDVEAAQAKVISVIRQLEEAEEITLDNGGEESAAA